ncbi:DUF5943 domain-containing protein [Bradyrhizobium sp. CB82]|uniref:4-vinyl reductase n=1 Tax=Bradyrhizobium sp. CB82 TaxID=3039159 RepID=UPI0024B099BD|nr:4-vinyl reductase [Bradyrhizobium sp. CB82]WFU44652.1 DUF5943 domain-containing protein [Bradyrhizobium sp. CB82]
MRPTIDIDVNEETGVWETDGLPMLYVPRHFMANVHNAVESELGLAAYKRVLDAAGSKSAYYWCKRQDEIGQFDGAQVFERYFQRLTARGWGQFRIETLDARAGSAIVTLKNSIYVLQNDGKADHPVCYMFEGFLSGSFRYVAERQGHSVGAIECREVQCEAMGFDNCRFELGAK